MKIQKSFKNNQNTLYIIPTPIGNLEDITIRTLNILKEIDVLYCEDKRVTQKLLNRYEIKVPTKSYHEHNKDFALSGALNDLEEGKNIGLVSDAGMPGISDPGYDLICAVNETDHNVVVLPGASAFLVALVRSNFPNNKFTYHGFLGTNKRIKVERLTEIFNASESSVFYESPHKLVATLKLMSNIDESKKITVAREITKLNEEYVQGTVKEVLAHFEENPIKGEFVIVVNPKEESEVKYEMTIEEHVTDLMQQGLMKKEAIKEVAKLRNMKKNDVYKLFVD